MSARKLASVRWWHGSTEIIRDFEVKPGSGGIHFGTKEQAMARRRDFLHEVELRIEAPCRAKDCQSWTDVAQRALARRKDAVVYLNRYECMTTERIAELKAAGRLDDLDDLTDSAFLRAVPEARDSVMVLHSDMIRLMRIRNRDGEVVWERVRLTSRDPEP